MTAAKHYPVQNETISEASGESNVSVHLIGPGVDNMVHNILAKAKESFLAMLI